MRNIWAIYKREVRAYFISPVAYTLYVIFFIICGYFFWAMVTSYAKYSMVVVQQRYYGGLPPFTEHVFRSLFFDMAIVLLLVVPLLTMRLFAEEKKMGTMELLLTYPIRDVEVVLGKFLAALSVFLLMLALSFLYPFLGNYVAGDQLEYGAVLCGYAGVFLMGTAFIATGIFFSTLTENQIVAATVTFGTLLMLWIIGWAAQLAEGAQILKVNLSEIVEQVSVLNHFEDFSKGVIDTGHLAYYILLSTLFIFLTLRVLDSNKWRG